MTSPSERLLGGYETLTGRRYDVSRLSSKEKRALDAALVAYDGAPEWADFSDLWQKEVAKALSGRTADERASHPLHRIGHDLEMRLGIAQGEVAPPDYRDYIVDRIEEKFGSR